MAERKLGRKTSPGFGDPHESVRMKPPSPRGASLRPGPDPHAHGGRSVPPPRLDAPPAPRVDSGRPTRVPRILEVEITQERGRTPRPDPLRRSFEVWTQNTV